MARVEYGLASLLFGPAHDPCSFTGAAALWSPPKATEYHIDFHRPNSPYGDPGTWIYGSNGVGYAPLYKCRRFLDLPPLTSDLLTQGPMRTTEEESVSRTYMLKDALWVILWHAEIVGPGCRILLCYKAPIVYNFNREAILNLIGPHAAAEVDRSWYSGPAFVRRNLRELKAMYIAGILARGWCEKSPDLDADILSLTKMSGEIDSGADLMSRVIDFLGPRNEELLLRPLGAGLSNDIPLQNALMGCATRCSRGGMLLSLADLWRKGIIAKPTSTYFDEYMIRRLQRLTARPGITPAYYEGLSAYIDAALRPLIPPAQAITGIPWLTMYMRRYFMSTSYGDKIDGEAELRYRPPRSAALVLGAFVEGCGSGTIVIRDFEPWPLHIAVLLHRPYGIRVSLSAEVLAELLSCPGGSESCLAQGTAMAVAGGLAPHECLKTVKGWSTQALCEEAYDPYLRCLDGL